MQFSTQISEQLAELKTKLPEKNFDSITDEQIIRREYRKEFLSPQLSQLIDKSTCRVGQSDADKYEQACLSIIEWTIGLELSVKPVHHPPSLKLDFFKRHIRDITMPLPQVTLSSIHWESIKNQHQVFSLVFECKNYSKTTKITNNEIYQLYEYLTPDQYGRLGIILSRYGRENLSNEANSAINRLSKDKYRILILGDNDLNEMIDDFVKTGSCSDFFTKQIEIARAYPQ